MKNYRQRPDYDYVHFVALDFRSHFSALHKYAPVHNQARDLEYLGDR